MGTAREDFIELEAYDLQKEIWKNRAALLGSAPGPFDLTKPWVGAYVLGLDYIDEPDLDCLVQARPGFKMAGFINRQKMQIAVSTNFNLEMQRFTAGHELGHFLLHPEINDLHHERPLKGMSHIFQPQPLREREANFFSGCFLMPRGLVEKEFQQRFGTSIRDFRFTEAIAWNMAPNDQESLLRPHPGSHSRALALASFSRSRISLAKCFEVSNSAMAYRLEELGLCAEWP